MFWTRKDQFEANTRSGTIEITPSALNIECCQTILGWTPLCRTTEKC